MAARDDDTRELKLEQERKAREESEKAESAELEQETAQHDRRAAKAAYLRDKLAERERSEREAE
jgi:hypothetical protein